MARNKTDRRPGINFSLERKVDSFRIRCLSPRQKIRCHFLLKRKMKPDFFWLQRDGMIGLQECGPAPPRAPVSGSRARERAAQAVDYYNTHVHRAWANAGLSASRSSFNDRHHNHQPTARRPHHLAPEQLYRSNSSLELLDHNGRPSNPSSPTLKREYGSHGSIDVIDRPPAGTSESFFAMLQDYQPAVLGAIAADQRSPGPSEYLRGKVDVGGDGVAEEAAVPQSPKSRVKLSRFWGSGGQMNVKNQKQAMDDSMVNTSSSSCSVVMGDGDDIARRRAFSHYDCQSLTTNLNYTAKFVSRAIPPDSFFNADVSGCGGCWRRGATRRPAPPRRR
jgi:hypothetical protein